MHSTRADVVRRVREQHDDIRRLFDDVATVAPSRRAAEFEPLVRLLAVHETAEEMVVYPAVVGAGPEALAAVRARRAEERGAKIALADLEGMDPSTRSFADAFEVFRAEVEAHAAAEEQEVLPLLEEFRSAGQLEALDRFFVAAEAIAPTHAHRFAPVGAIGNLVLGPFVSVVDRTRDLLCRSRSRARAVSGAGNPGSIKGVGKQSRSVSEVLDLQADAVDLEGASGHLHRRTADDVHELLAARPGQGRHRPDPARWRPSGPVAGARRRLGRASPRRPSPRAGSPDHAAPAAINAPPRLPTGVGGLVRLAGDLGLDLGATMAVHGERVVHVRVDALACDDAPALEQLTTLRGADIPHDVAEAHGVQQAPLKRRDRSTGWCRPRHRRSLRRPSPTWRGRSAGRDRRSLP